MLICEIIAENADMSDGERRYLPVLPTKEFITETLPFYVEANGKTTVELSSLFNHHSATAHSAEWSSNIQTIPPGAPS
jgi:hypothetical protein